MSDETPIKQRLHITFGKFGALKYTGNLDTAKLWERALRRAGLPLLYSAGFNPRPRLQLASALPLGITSECEILDVSLREAVELAGLREKLLAVSPEGLQIYAIDDVPPRTAALQTRVRSAEYRIRFEDGIDRAVLQARISALLQSDEIIRVRERRGRRVAGNIRGEIYDLWLDDAGCLRAHLAVGERGNVRPDELLQQMELAEMHHSVHRTRLHLDPDA